MSSSTSSSRTKIALFGGADEIGGNKIFVEDGATKIFLDFGKSFSQRAKYYDWIGKPRIVNGIGDLIHLDIVPNLRGIYRKDLLSLAGSWTEGERDRTVDAVILSHAHADHADYISLLREDIPVYMGEMTLEILETLEAERNSDIEFEITGFKERPIESRKDERIKREIHTFNTGSGEFSIDSISVEPIHVDHSLPGCYGFILRTRDSTIAYTGDLRMHGYHPELTRDFVCKASEARPDILLCEGTRIQEPHSLSEQDVCDSFNFFVEQAKHLFVFADFSYKDIDRFVTFHELARKTGRKLLIDTKSARYLDSLSKRDPRMEIPNSHDPDIGIYKPREQKYSKDDEREYYSLPNTWTFEDVRKKESSVIFAACGADELIDVRPKGGLYLHGTTESFDEAGDIDEERTQNWIQKFALTKIHSHCSGHASATELVKIANEINPKAIVPIHTTSPQTFETFFGGRIRLARIGQTIEV